MGKIQPRRVQAKNGEPLTFRSATVADAREMNIIAHDVFKTSDFLITTPTEFASFTDEKQAERIRKFEEDENGIALIVLHNDEIVGMLDCINGKRSRVAHRGAFGMSVKSSWRGKGVGEILLRGLIHWARENPVIEILTLTVIEPNTPARALYKKLGFEETGRNDHGVKLEDGTYLAEIQMSLKL